MKTLRAFLLVIGIALVSLTLPSCLDDDDSYSLGDIWIAVATVVPEGNNVYYLRLDDGDKLWPAATNYPNYQPKPNQRALVNFTILADSTQSNLGGFSHYVKVNAIHNILTKSIAKNEGAANDSIYGTDPVSIYENNMWIGDGYLNIYFETLWGGKTAHFINLMPRMILIRWSLGITLTMIPNIRSGPDVWRSTCLPCRIPKERRSILS